ncbi:MAG: hypothetical protein ACT4QC_01870 [Planctomycetaceae bacterium]
MKWWLVTWSTYGSWLPGDPRGFQTWRGKEYVPPPKRYAKVGEQIYDVKQYAGRYNSARTSMIRSPVTLTPAQRAKTLEGVVDKVGKLKLRASVLAVCAQHSHLLAKFGALKIRRTVGFLKAEATKRLHDGGVATAGVWGKECHMKSKNEGREFRNAFEYVRRHADEGAAIYIWPEFRHLVQE